MKKQFRRWARFSVAGLMTLTAVMLSTSGCSGRANPPPPPVENRAPVEPPPVEHRVSYSGETLALIASWYTGKSTNWTLIRDANPNLRPERINIGQRILIPANLVTEHNPMPKKFVQDSLAKVRSSKPAADDTPAAPTDNGTPDFVPDKAPVGNTGSAPKAPPPTEEDINLNDLIGKEETPTPDDSGAAKHAPTPDPTKAPSEPPPTPAKDPEKKAPADKGDAEREQLLDELLAQ
ncbi:MAG: LysM peptidoglycan-binding domain-containing protein [Bdellovibrionota bacterium]